MNALVGTKLRRFVTYDDPDGENACCYNSEMASMRLHLWDRG